MVTRILESQLHIPVQPQGSVLRPRLLAVLEQEVMHCKLTLITAPAGYGKTSLLAEWARESSLPIAWLTLTHEEDDPIRFLRYMLAAWDKAQPGIVDAPFGLLLRALMPDLQSVLDNFIHTASQLPGELVFVVDDYHLAVGPAIHNALGFILDHLPAQVHFILAGRSEPPLPLARYRARRQLLELNTGDLHFTPAESADFLTRLMGLDLSSKEVADLYAKTEGWAAGLQLAALALRRREHAEDLPLVSGRQRFIADYLSEEVLSGLPAEVRRFILQTSLLERLCGPLCDAVTEGEGGQEMLELLEGESLFLVPLDDRREWFRYHTLFADFLQGELSRRYPQEVASLHVRSARWYLDHDLPEPAFSHALAGEDLSLLSDLMKRYTIAKLMAGEYTLVKRWLESIPEAWYSRNPELGLYQAMFLINTGAFEAAARQVDEVEHKLLAAGSGQAQGRLAGVTAMRCFIACSQNDMARAQSFANQALRDLKVNEDVGFRPGIYVSLGDTYRANGRWEEAKECYLKALSFAEVPGVRVASVHLYGALADLDLKQGNLHQAATYWRKALAVIQDRAAWGWYSLPVMGWVYIRLGEVLYEWNNLEEAREHLARGLERAELGGDVRARIAGYLLAFRLKLVEGDLQAAGKYLEQVQSLLESSPFPEWIPRFERLQLEFWLAQNHLRAAVQRAGELLQGAALDRQHESETAQLAVARAFIAQGDAPSLKHARQLLTSLIEAAQAKGRIAISIEAQALQALVYWKRGDPASAMTYLEGALRQAEPEGYARLFVDLGLPMVRLLQEARLRAVLPEYVEKLLAACEVNLPFPVSTEKRLPEPLTPREQEILELLSAGLTNAEIAEKLIISPETVKKHLRHLYGKLGTGNRTEAVARARALSLLG